MRAPRPGAPVRDTGLPPGVAVGGLGRRVVATLVDSIVPAIVALLLGRVVPTSTGAGGAVVAVLAIAVGIAWALVCWWMLSQRAATPGMTLMKIQLVGFLDGRPVGWSRVLMRWVVYTLLAATGVGLLLMVIFLLIHPRHQGWHDLVAGAVVIAQRPLAPPRPPSVANGPRPVAAPASTSARTPVAASTGRGSGVARGGGGSEPADLVPVGAPVAASAAAPAPGPEDEGSGFEPDRPVPGTATDKATPSDDGRPRAESEPSGSADDAPDDAPTAAPRSILQGWLVELDDGREIAVEGLVLVGRNPQPASGEEDARLVAYSDDSRTVSKTHLALGVDDAGLFVVDRGSTNGSTVTTPDRVSTRCAPFTAVSVGIGSIVSIGDHWMRIRRSDD